MTKNKVNDNTIEVNLDAFEQDREILEESLEAIVKLADKYQTSKYGPVFVTDDDLELYESLEDAHVLFNGVGELVSYIDDLEMLSWKMHDSAEVLIQLFCVFYRILESAREKVDDLPVKLNS